MDAVPEDVWMRMFECSALDGAQNLVCLALVCRAWRTLAERVMYRHISLASERQLRRFCTTMSIMQKDGTDIGGFVRSLSITLPQEGNFTDLTWSSLASLLFFVPHLRSFELAPRPVVPCILRCLTRFAADSLVSLRVVVHKGGYITIFTHINELPALQTLKITCANTERWNFSKVRPLALKSVTDFRWVWAEHCENDSMVRFLAQSTFAPGGTWALVISQLPIHMAAQLEPWISAHTLREIALDVPREAMLALGDPLALIPTISLLKPPLPSLFDGRTWPATLRLCVDHAELQPLYEFLNGTIAQCVDPGARDRVVGRLRSVAVRTIGAPPFTWKSAAPTAEGNCATLTGQLMYYAIELDKHSIRLLDSESRDVESYFGSSKT